MKRIFAVFGMIAVVGMVMPSGHAYADSSRKGEHHGHKNKGHHTSKHVYRDDHDAVKIVIHDTDRVYIREYIGREYYTNCPPGLAKKHNGCRPPGHTKHYVIGRPLATTVIYEEVPAPLLVHLQPVPVGYRYVMVDKDVLLISEATKNVIDAVTLLSAVGN